MPRSLVTISTATTTDAPKAWATAQQKHSDGASTKDDDRFPLHITGKLAAMDSYAEGVHQCAKEYALVA